MGVTLTSTKSLNPLINSNLKLTNKALLILPASQPGDAGQIGASQHP